MSIFAVSMHEVVCIRFVKFNSGHISYSCIFAVPSFFRVKSHVLLIPFGLPSTGPTTSAQYDAFEDFEQALQKTHFSSAVGWMISQREVLLSDSTSFVSEVKDFLRDVFQGNVPNITGWALCLYFLTHYT